MALTFQNFFCDRSLGSHILYHSMLGNHACICPPPQSANSILRRAPWRSRCSRAGFLLHPTSSITHRRGSCTFCTEKKVQTNYKKKYKKKHKEVPLLGHLTHCASMCLVCFCCTLVALLLLYCCSLVRPKPCSLNPLALLLHYCCSLARPKPCSLNPFAQLLLYCCSF
jgi:hypothetical protein